MVVNYIIVGRLMAWSGPSYKIKIYFSHSDKSIAPIGRPKKNVMDGKMDL